MIPILYESNEVQFASNGLGRLRDAISVVVTEERNSIYECNFSYPITGTNYDRIKLGRIIAVEHDDTGDVQPFDIVSCSRPINGVVEFHCVHLSYRQRFMTVSGTNINSLSDAFTALGTASPSNPFTYETDKTSTGYVAAFDDVPRSVRSILGGVEGSILDAYGGEYEWDRWNVKLWASRGKTRNFTIRYGVNMTEYNEELDYSSTYTSVIPFWKGSDGAVVKGSKVASGATPYNGVESVVPLDLSDKFESQPTTAQLESMAASYMSSNQTYLPAQNIEVDFIRLQDSAEYEYLAPLLNCSLCDSIKVEMPLYNTSGTFKIVKTEWDVLQERFTSMELGKLSTTLSEALGISGGNGLTSKTETTRTTFTPTGCSNYANYGGSYYEKYGNIVHVHVGVSGLTANTSKVIYTLPSGYIPATPIFGHGTGGSWNNLGYVQIQTNGQIFVESAGTYCGADVTYMV